MNNEIEPVRTVYPQAEDQLYLANQVAKGAHDLSIMQARLVYVLMAQILPRDDGFYTVEMKIGDIIRALNMNLSARTYQEFRSVVKGIMSKVISIKYDDGSDHLFNWFHECVLNRKKDTIIVRFHDNLVPFLLQLKKAFHIHTLADLSKLQSRYALRIYEIVMSNAGFAGKAGNKPNEWYVDLQFDQIRAIFMIADTKYKQTRDFRLYVIDYPVHEINEAHIGVSITCDYDKWRRGRRLDGVRLHCRRVLHNCHNVTPGRTAAEREEEEEARRLNPDLFETAFQEKMNELETCEASSILPPNFKTSVAKSYASAVCSEHNKKRRIEASEKLEKRKKRVKNEVVEQT